VILGLEVTDFWGTLHLFREQLIAPRRAHQPGARSSALRRATCSQEQLQDFQRYTEVDLAIAATPKPHFRR